MTTYKNMTVEHLGTGATDIDLTEFIEYCERLAEQEPEWSDDNVTDAIFGDGNYIKNAGKLGLMTAQEFANTIEYPVVFFVSGANPVGISIALLADTELPFDLDDVTGSVTNSGTFDAKNLNASSASDWNSCQIYRITVSSDKKIWNQQNDEHNSCE